MDITKWETGTFLLFAALASVIGTIIYHLEKNLHSYPLQLAYEYHYQGSGIMKSIGILLLTFAPIVSLCAVEYFNKPSLLIFIVAGCYLLLAISLLRTGKKRLIESTLNQWLWEEKAGQLNKDAVLPINSDENLKKVATMKKISTWSDFIHCVQSCCFAWIFGSLLAYYISGSSVSGFYHGMTIAFMLLVAELIIDMHRYRFVNCIINNKTYSQPHRSSLSDKLQQNMSNLPDFKQYKKRNIVVSEKTTDINPDRCWMNIPADKLPALENDVFIFDCNIDGRRYCWCAPAVVLLAAFEQKKLHQANKDGAPYAPYLDYKKGIIYNSPCSSETEIVCQLSRITDGNTFAKLLKSI